MNSPFPLTSIMVAFMLRVTSEYIHLTPPAIQWRGFSDLSVTILGEINLDSRPCRSSGEHVDQFCDSFFHQVHVFLLR